MVFENHKKIIPREADAKRDKSVVIESGIWVHLWDLRESKLDKLFGAATVL